MHCEQVRLGGERERERKKDVETKEREGIIEDYQSDDAFN